MARPKKNGLDYFPLDADFFASKKIKILKSRYGADGVVIYIYLLCEIYKKGYYLKVDSDFEYIISDDLNMSIDKVKQVLTFLLERSMFDKQLFQSDAVLTSAGIQRRFQLAVKERAKKNPIKVDGFWLLEKSETEPFIKVTLFEDFSQKNVSYSGKNSNNSREKSLKKSKVNNIYIYYKNPQLNEAFNQYISMRQEKDGINDAQIDALRYNLEKLSQDDQERIAIIKKAFVSGWKSFYPISHPNGQKQQNNIQQVKGNQFHNFDQREYDYKSLEKRFIEQVNGKVMES